MNSPSNHVDQIDLKFCIEKAVRMLPVKQFRQNHSQSIDGIKLGQKTALLLWEADLKRQIF